MFQKILEIWGEVEGLKEVVFIFSSFPNSNTKKKKKQQRKQALQIVLLNSSKQIKNGNNFSPQVDPSGYSLPSFSLKPWKIQTSIEKQNRV